MSLKEQQFIVITLIGKMLEVYIMAERIATYVMLSSALLHENSSSSVHSL